MLDGGIKIYGPYHKPRRGAKPWALVVIKGTVRTELYYSLESEAKAEAEALRQEVSTYTIEHALDDYREHMERKGNRQKSIATTMTRLTNWLAGKAVAITEPKLKTIYQQRIDATSVDTARNELSEVKTFFRWLVKQKRIKSSPAEGIDGIGRRNKGKPQLRQSEAQRFAEACIELYNSRHRGYEAGLANLMALVLGMRASEICSLRLRDIDYHARGCTVWIDRGKTDAATRRLEAPAMLQPLLLRQIALSKKRCSDWLFAARDSDSGHRERTWLRKSARRIAALADVPYAPPHGLRGTCATLASDAGTAGSAVARQLGHERLITTKEHYMENGTLERANAARMANALATEDQAVSIERYSPYVRVDTRYARHRAAMRQSERGSWVRLEVVAELLQEIEELRETINRSNHGED